MYEAIITTIQKIRKHSNADRLYIAEIFGNDVIIDNSFSIGQKVIYFPVDGQLSKEFAEKNGLIECYDENGKNIGGYLDAKKRNIKAIKLRGERSEGLLMPLECLSDYCDISKLADGDKITVLGGHEICKKYVRKHRVRQQRQGDQPKPAKKIRRTDNVRHFAEHIDTAQLAYNLSDFNCGDEIEITIKLHGTSQRTGYLPALKDYNDSTLQRIKNDIKRSFCKISHKQFEAKHDGSPVFEWETVNGTRRTVLNGWDGGYYNSNLFRKTSAEAIAAKLHKGETAYYEVVGFTETSTPIMGIAQNKKTGDKEFVKQYGKETVFSYGCAPNSDYAPQNDFYIYRMTMTNEDGDVVEYSPDFMRYRCNEMGVKAVPAVWHGFIPDDVNPGEYIKEVAEKYYDGRDPIGKTHIREGVVVRILNRPTFTAYKHKNFYFKCLAGIIADQLTQEQVDNMSDDVLSEL